MLRDGTEPSKRGIFVKTKDTEGDGIAVHTDLQIDDQVLTINCMHMEQRMTVYRTVGESRISSFPTYFSHVEPRHHTTR